MKRYVCSEKVYSPEDFLAILTGKYYLIGDDPIKEIHEILVEEGIENDSTETLWDYPLNEIDEVIENEVPVVLVKISEKEYRWFEIPDENMFKEDNNA